MTYSTHDREQIPLQNNSILIHFAANHLNSLEGFVVAAAPILVGVVAAAAAAAAVAAAGIRVVSTHEPLKKAQDFQILSINSYPLLYRIYMLLTKISTQNIICLELCTKNFSYGKRGMKRINLPTRL